MPASGQQAASRRNPRVQRVSDCEGNATALESILRALKVPSRGHAFKHGASHALDRGVRLFDSYHCSRYNTNTGRLTAAMFKRVFRDIERHLNRERSRAHTA